IQQAGCWTWSAHSTDDGDAKIKCNSSQCWFEYVHPSHYGHRRQLVWPARSASDICVSYETIPGATMGPEEECFRWSRAIDEDKDTLCAGCPWQVQTPPSLPYYGRPICDASCQGEEPSFGFESPLVLDFGLANIQFTGKPVGFDFYGDGSKPL